MRNLYTIPATHWTDPMNFFFISVLEFFFKYKQRHAMYTQMNKKNVHQTNTNANDELNEKYKKKYSTWVYILWSALYYVHHTELQYLHTWSHIIDFIKVVWRWGSRNRVWHGMHLWWYFFFCFFLILKHQLFINIPIYATMAILFNILYSSTRGIVNESVYINFFFPLRIWMKKWTLM